MTTLIAPRVRFLGRMLRASGPYLLLEILLPGGTLFALLLFYFQRRGAVGPAGGWPHRVAQTVQAFSRALAAAMDPAVTSAWRGVDGDDGLQALAMAPAR